MTPEADNEEIIKLLAWSFEEAEKWLFESLGRALDDNEAVRIREILESRGMYGDDKSWRIKLHQEKKSGKT